MDHRLLLQHTDWVRRLAEHLVYDAAQVDDVIQRTWLEALERPPRHDANPRGWLARVLRNAARQESRTESRRRDRERAFAASGAVPATVDLVERADLGRHLASLVLELEEPYRSTLLLRFFEGLEPQEIARRSGESSGTVRSRLKRGLDRLRERLDDEAGGSRRAWGLALIPLGRAAAGTAATKLAPWGWLAAIAVAAALVVGGVEFASWLGAGAIDEGLGGTPGGDASVRTAMLGPQDSGLQDSGLQDSGALTPARREAAVVLGSVRDHWGEPATGAEVFVVPDPGPRGLDLAQAVRGRTDAEGRYRVELPGRMGPVAVQVVADGGGFAIARGLEPVLSLVNVGSLTLNSPRFLRGRVVDEAGGFIAHAAVKVLFSHGRGLVDQSTTADARGYFQLQCRAGGGTGAELAAVAPGYGPGLATGEVSSEDGYTMVLPRGRAIEGMVRDDFGDPVAGAQVGVDLALYRLSHSGGSYMADPLRETTTRSDGSFRLDDCAPGLVSLRARKDGFDVGSDIRVNVGRDGGRAEIVLRREPETGRVRGRVLHGITGEPVAGVRVGDQVLSGEDGAFELRKLPARGIDRPIRFFIFSAVAEGFGEVQLRCGWSGDDTDLVIEIFPAVTVRALVLDPEGRPVPGVNMQFKPDQEKAEAEGRPAPRYNSTQSGSDGVIEKQIPAGPYSVITVYDGRFAKEILIHDFDPQPGSLHEWTFVMGEGRRLQGRVFDEESGAAVEGARISLWWGEGADLRSHASTHSGWEGSFLLRGVGEQRPWLKVDAEGYAPQVVQLDLPGPETPPPGVRVGLRAPLSLRGTVVDADGRPQTAARVIIEASVPEPRRRIYGKFFDWEIDAAGGFEIAGLPELPFEVSIHLEASVVERFVAPRGQVVEPPFRERKWVLDFKGREPGDEAPAAGSGSLPSSPRASPRASPPAGAKGAIR